MPVTAFKKDMDVPTVTKVYEMEIEAAYFNFKEILTIKITRMVSLYSYITSCLTI